MADSLDHENNTEIAEISVSDDACQPSKKQDDQLYIRFVLSPDNVIYPDIYQKLPIRNKSEEFFVEYNSEDFGCFLEHCKESNYTMCDNVLETIKSQLLNYIIELVSMCMNAGQLIYGFEKVQYNIKKGKRGLLFSGTKEDRDSRKKLERIYIRYNPEKTIDELDVNMLAKATGKRKPVYIFIEYGGLSKKIIVQVNKYRKICNMVLESESL